jgi:hypothetical protein
MQVLSGSVGEADTNQVHDVALVQAILLKTTRAAAPNRAAAPYLGNFDARTVVVRVTRSGRSSWIMWSRLSQTTSPCFRRIHRMDASTSETLRGHN